MKLKENKPRVFIFILCCFIHFSASAQDLQSVNIRTSPEGKPEIPKSEGECPFTSLESSTDKNDLQLIQLQTSLIEARKKIIQCIADSSQNPFNTSTSHQAGNNPTLIPKQQVDPMIPNQAPDLDCLDWQKRLQSEYTRATSSALGAMGSEYSSCEQNGKISTGCSDQILKAKTEAMKKYCTEVKVKVANQYVEQLNTEIKNAIQLITNNPECASIDNLYYLRITSSALKEMSRLVPDPKYQLIGASSTLLQSSIDLIRVMHQEKNIHQLKTHENFKNNACNLFLASKGDSVFNRCNSENAPDSNIKENCPENAPLDSKNNNNLRKLNSNLAQKNDLLEQYAKMIEDDYRDKLKAENKTLKQLKNTKTESYAEALESNLSLKLDMCMKTPRVWFKKKAICTTCAINSCLAFRIDRMSLKQTMTFVLFIP
jgi:hypothetical protein